MTRAVSGFSLAFAWSANFKMVKGARWYRCLAHFNGVWFYIYLHRRQMRCFWCLKQSDETMLWCSSVSYVCMKPIASWYTFQNKTSLPDVVQGWEGNYKFCRHYVLNRFCPYPYIFMVLHVHIWGFNEVNKKVKGLLWRTQVSGITVFPVLIYTCFCPPVHE